VSILVRFNNLSRLMYEAACATYASACNSQPLHSLQPAELAAKCAVVELEVFNPLYRF
jgi:hypothetical protein